MTVSDHHGEGRSAELHRLPGYNSPIYLLRAVWLYSHQRECNSRSVAEGMSGLNSGVEYNDEDWRIVARVLGSPGLRRLTFHVLEAEAVTLLIARVSLGLSLGSAVRHLEDLTSFGVIRPSVKLLRPAGVRGGRRVLVYSLPDAKLKQVEAVCNVQRKLENPLYMRALEVAERLLLRPSLKDLSYGAVAQEVKAAVGIQDVASVTECVVRILSEKGIRVWR